jgi:cutinase
VSGYSQGGQIVHNAAKLLPAATMAKVNSVVIFGDPDDGTAVAGASAARTLVICHETDDICLHGDLILLAHLTYAEDAGQAAAFVVANSGL